MPGSQPPLETVTVLNEISWKSNNFFATVSVPTIGQILQAQVDDKLDPVAMMEHFWPFAYTLELLLNCCSILSMGIVCHNDLQ